MSAIFTRSCFFNTYTFAFDCTKKMPTILIFIEKAKFHLMPCGSISFELFLCRQSFNKLWILTHCTHGQNFQHITNLTPNLMPFQIIVCNTLINTGDICKIAEFCVNINSHCSTSGDPLQVFDSMIQLTAKNVNHIYAVLRRFVNGNRSSVEILSSIASPYTK